MFSLFNGRTHIGSLVKDLVRPTITHSENVGNGLGVVPDEPLTNMPDDSLLSPTHDPTLWVPNKSDSSEHLVITRSASPASVGNALQVPPPNAPIAPSSSYLSPSTHGSWPSGLSSQVITRSSSRNSISESLRAQYLASANMSLRLEALCHAALLQTGILASLAQVTPWRDFYALISTCAAFRRLFGSPDIKEIILSEYVPGYRQALLDRELERYQDIPVTLHDLNLLQISLSISLYEYSAHAQAALALSTMGSAWSLEEWKRMTEKLNALSLTHSRFVLLLQSLVHSSSFPPLPEGNELGLYSGSFPLAHRELVFPAPLFSEQGDTHSPREHVSGPYVRASTDGTKPNVTIRERASSDSTSSKSGSKRKRRLSVFGKKEKVPPPPPSHRITELYAGSWRRTHPSGYADPKSDRSPRRFSSVESDFFPSRPASIRFSHISRSQGALMRSTGSIIQHSPLDIHPHPPFHYLTMALSRTRAPILRVFVPCSRISDRSIQECEELLVQGGLWHHLSTGDLVWNLGYTLSAIHPDVEQPLGSWLVYNGERLLPFYASEPPPIDDPLLLPSPLYFQHIIPPFTNPQFVLRIPPNGRNAPPPPLTLVHTSRRVPSPLSGYAVVKQYVWTARIRMWSQDLIMDGLGDGWQGAWILETEGTREGRQKLADCLFGGVERPWTCEIMREMSEDGQLWIKLLHPYSVGGPPIPPPKVDPRRDSFHAHVPMNTTMRKIVPGPGQHLRPMTV